MQKRQKSVMGIQFHVLDLCWLEISDSDLISGETIGNWCNFCVILWQGSADGLKSKLKLWLNRLD
jgi:hypothetical protein